MHRVLFIALVLGLLASMTLAFNREEDGEEVFRIFVTGADQGILEPCGCSGGQLGGIARRGNLLKALTYNSPNLILATGGLSGGTDTLNLIRFQILLICLDEMGYRAAGLGPEELKLGLEKIREFKEYVEFPFILTNVAFPGEETLPFLPSLVEEVAGFQVRILAIIPESLEKALPRGAEFIPPDLAIEKAIDQSPGADLTVVLLRGTREEAKALDPLLPDPKLVFYSYPHSESRIYDFFNSDKDGVIRYLSPGDRGRFIISCGLTEGPEGMLDPFKPDVDEIELDFKESEAILDFMDWYRDLVIEEKVLEEMVELNPAPDGAPYVGNGTCIVCHEKSYATWKASGHARAWATLEDEKVNRAFDPECMSCHVVGFGTKTGFRNKTDTDYLLDVGCESCHGPCSKHVASAGSIKTPLKVDCATCHNLDHSPEFDQKEYWEKIPCSPDGTYTLPIHGKSIENSQVMK